VTRREERASISHVTFSAKLQGKPRDAWRGKRADRSALRPRQHIISGNLPPDDRVAPTDSQRPGLALQIESEAGSRDPNPGRRKKRPRCSEARFLGFTGRLARRQVPQVDQERIRTTGSTDQPVRSRCIGRANAWRRRSRKDRQQHHEQRNRAIRYSGEKFSHKGPHVADVDDLLRRCEYVHPPTA
jgi:hypothetical protein